MEVLNRAAIKADARNFIGQNRRWLSMALACLPLFLLQGAISGGITVLQRATQDGDVQYTASVGTNVITWLLIPFTVAMAGYYLNQIRGFNPEWQSLYKEGLDRYGKYFTVGLVTQIFICLWMLLLIVPGIIKSYEYRFVHNVIHDNPNLSQSQARDLSRRMTDGFKSDLFVLDLSFILWYMLPGVTFGLAAFYVVPYMQTTQAMYYENLKNYAIAQGKAAPEEFGLMPVPPYGVQPPVSAQPYAQNPQAPYPENPYAANPYAQQAPSAENPYAQNAPYTPPQAPYVDPNVQAQSAQPFTPPAPESTFVPGGETPTADKPVFNNEEADNDKQDF
ncbi:MAG: DUF975 family protein [Clostridia bacterium]|nr:DUF975 family protein [Clostridia bacterium]